MRPLTFIVAAMLTMVAAPASRAQLTAPEIANLLGDREIFYDDDGLIIHRRPNGEPDGGDTSQREGWYWLGVWIRQNTPGLSPWTKPRRLNFDQVLALLEPNRDGVFYRHPKLPPWNNPHAKDYGYSRDQMEPLVAAMGVWGKTAEIQRLWNALPEDLLGKHAFNGNWRNFLGQDGRNCSDIKKRGCDATKDCSLKVDNRDCSLKVDTRDCSLKLDTRDCSLQVDTRSCGHEVCVPLLGCTTVNDPVCEGAKAAQNLIYKANHDACEAGKAAQNVAYKGEHDACEAGKAAQNLAYKGEHDTCEAAKFAQNAAYKVEHDACEVEKAIAKATCEAQKTADLTLCMITNVHSGDIVGPMTVNLFRRAVGENPLIPISGMLALPPVNIASGTVGETELAVNVGTRIVAGLRDRDDTGDDLNLIVKLIMARLRFPTPLSDAATRIYAEQRPFSFGSYLITYHQTFGIDTTDIANRIADGIDNKGWKPDVSAPIGAVRWYHRPDTGANPQLSELYESIISHYIK